MCTCGAVSYNGQPSVLLLSAKYDNAGGIKPIREEREYGNKSYKWSSVSKKQKWCAPCFTTKRNGIRVCYISLSSKNVRVYNV